MRRHPPNMFSFLARHKTRMPTRDEALPGRSEELDVPSRHVVLGSSMKGPFPEPHAFAMFGMGCFWGAERFFWQADGVISTAVGYAGGFTENPTYQEVCSGRTGHNEVVRVVYDPRSITYDALLKLFFENHDPTQGMRQGNDVGTQYRSGIYVYSEDQRQTAQAVKKAYAGRLAEKGFGDISTELLDAPIFYFAEEYHQQYLHKNPGGYCNHGFNGVSCPVGVGV